MAALQEKFIVALDREDDSLKAEYQTSCTSTNASTSTYCRANSRQYRSACHRADSRRSGRNTDDCPAYGNIYRCTANPNTCRHQQPDIYRGDQPEREYIRIANSVAATEFITPVWDALGTPGVE